MDDDEFELDEDEELDNNDNDNNQTPMDRFMQIFNENKKLFIIIGVVILLLIIMSAVTKSNNSSSIKLSEEEKTITLESGIKLKLLDNGSEITRGISWESSDYKIATVDPDGTVHGKSVGKVTITATYENEKYKCEITVSEGDAGIAVESVKFPDGTLVMTVGSTYTPAVEINPSEAKVKNKYFSVSNENIATVDITSGLVTAKSLGKAMLRVAVNDALRIGNLEIQVVETEIPTGIYVLPTSITLSEKEITLTEGERKAITYTQEPESSPKDYVKWTSADPTIAVVENNELIARKPGDVEIAVISFGVKDIMKVHVKAASVEVQSISITSSTTMSMNVGETKKINAKISPDNASNKEIVYDTNNSTVAVVDSVGNVTATGSGSTTIKVSSASKPNIYGTVTVNVAGSTTPTDPVDPTDPGGGGTPSGGGTTVGTVKLTSNNDAVESSVSAVSGKTMTSTKLTITKSGNVDKILYCYYEYNVQSDCSTYNVYSAPFEFRTPGTFVFKVVPYYNNNAGTQIVRYVKITGSSTTYHCQSGRYWNGSSCLACPAGNYCSGDKKVACPAGKGSIAYASAPSDCDYCAKGTYSTGDGQGCRACPSGTTTNSSGATSSAQCISSGATTIKCTAGTYYNGAGGCSQCPANYWCPGVTESKTKTTVSGKNACGSGMTSPAGSSSSSQCTSSSTTVDCYAGSYYNGRGSCSQCPANYWCPGVSESNTKTTESGKNACGSGLTSPAGSTSSSQCTSSTTATRPNISSVSIPNNTTDYVYGILAGHWPFIELNNLKGTSKYNRIALCYYVVSRGGALKTNYCTSSSSKGSDITGFERSGRQVYKVPKVENKWHIGKLTSDVTTGSYYVETEQMDAWAQGDNRYDLILVIKLGYYDGSKILLSTNDKTIRVKSTNATPFVWPIEKVN